MSLSGAHAFKVMVLISMLKLTCESGETLVRIYDMTGHQFCVKCREEHPGGTQKKIEIHKQRHALGSIHTFRVKGPGHAYSCLICWEKQMGGSKIQKNVIDWEKLYNGTMSEHCKAEPGAKDNQQICDWFASSRKVVLLQYPMIQYDWVSYIEPVEEDVATCFGL